MGSTLEEYKEIFRDVPGNAALYRVSGGIIKTLFYSPSLPRLSGMTNEEYDSIIKNDALDIVHKNDRESVAKIMEECLREHSEKEFTYRIRYHKNAFVWTHAVAKQIGEYEGDSILLVSFFNSSRESEMLAILLDHTTRSIYVVDSSNYDLLYTNDNGMAEHKCRSYSENNCYSYIRGLQQPCEHCPAKLMDSQNPLNTEWYDKTYDKYYMINAYPLSWYGRAANAFFYEDITEKKRADIQLKEKNDTLENILQNIPAAICVFRIDNEGTKCIAVSPHFCKLMNVSENSVLNDSFEDVVYRFVHPKDLPFLKDELKSIVNGDITRSSSAYRVRGISPGNWLWLRSDIISIAQEDGSSYIYSCLIDVTAQKLSEENHARFVDGLMKSDPNTLGIFRLDLTKNLCTGAKDDTVNVLRLKDSGTAENFLRSIQTKIEDERERLEFSDKINRIKLLEAFHNGRTTERMRFRRLTSDKEQRWTDVYVYVSRSPVTGNIEAILRVSDADDTATEEAIIRSIVTDEFDSIGIIDVRKRTIKFRNINNSAVSTTPHIMEDYDGDIKNAIQLVIGKPEDQEECYKATSLSRLVKELETHSSYSYPYTLHDTDGRQYRKMLKFSYIDETKQEIMISRTDTTQDYMQQKNQMRMLQDALDSAQKANAAKSEFLSRVSHDIRTPMNIIKGMTDFAYQDASNPGKLKNDLDHIRTANLFLLSLINDVLDLSRIDSGKVELHPEPYSYSEFLSNITNIMEPMCNEKGLTFSVSETQTQGRARAVIVDKVRLNQIMLNLLTNSAKYTPAGGSVGFDVSETVGSDGTVKCLFVISDTGIGMSKEFQDKMFEAFTQEDTTSITRLSHGTGLGLSIVKKLIDLFGGEISVKSAPGEGSKFTVKLTLRLAKESDINNELEEQKSTVTHLSGRILLVEDNPLNNEIAQRLLESIGLQVETAEDGREALNVFISSEQGRFSAILMDIQMPIMNGYEATRAIRALKRSDAIKVPIIAMTANAYAEDVQKCLDAGMDSHIAKPIDSALLFSELARLIRKD